MGTLKFYNGGQSVTEEMWFGRADATVHKSNYSLSVYPSQTYVEKELTTATNKTYPLYGYEAQTGYSDYNGYLKRFGIPVFNTSSPNNRYGAMFGSSDTTHDKTLATFHNSVASTGYLAETTYNGVKTLVLSITNLDNSNSVTVCSIQRSNCTQFVSDLSTACANSYAYFLDWAYYLDPSEYITLGAGETKTVVITISLADLTA